MRTEFNPMEYRLEQLLERRLERLEKILLYIAIHINASNTDQLYEALEPTEIVEDTTAT